MGKLFHRLILETRQQDRIALQIGPKALDERILAVTDAEADPFRPHIPTQRDRLLEQWDAGLGPEVAAEQIGGVRTHGHQGGREDLGGIVGAGGPWGSRLPRSL